VRDFSIHCFEPSGEAFKCLVESAAGDNRVKLNNIAVGRKKGRAVLYYNDVGSGLASLTKRRLDHFGIDFNGSENVETLTIDGYCEENAIKHIHLLKIDIEGHELDALAGAKRMFDQRAIDMVTFEFGGCNIDTQTFFQDFWYFFKEVDMKIFRITPSGYMCSITSYKEIDEQFRTINYIAVLNE
jgi:FkbM family methyltransferase